MAAAPSDAVGARIPRIDAGEKIAGTARFLDDLTRPGMLYAALAVSEYAHARLLSIDISAALALPGVKAIITGENFALKRVGGFVKDETMLAHGKVRYLGEPIAAVAAIDRRTARQAARLIAARYEPLPTVLSIEEALDPSAPLLHEEIDSYVKVRPGNTSGNLVWESIVEEGNVDAAWAECDVIVEEIYRTQAQHHGYIEPNGVLAEVEPGGRVCVTSSCQSVHHVQQRVAEELSLPMSKVRALVPRVGGGFGGKHASAIHSIAAALAMKTGRPVKFALSRTEDFEIQRCRHPARIRLKTGARHDGTLVAREAEIILDGGAYADESAAVMSFAILMVRGPYRVPHLRSRGRVVYTNKIRSGSFRGFGNPQASFASESQMDELAARLGMDPVALRLKNAMHDGDRWAGGQTVPSCKVSACLELVRDAQAAAPALPTRPGYRRGLGYSAFAHICGLMGTSAAVHLKADGSIALSTGIVDIGQGSDTALTQICAGLLQVPVDLVSFGSPDSDSSPYNWKTAGSRITYMGGRAVHAAAADARDKIFAHAAEMLECASADLELQPGGRVGITGVPDQNVTFKEVALRSLYGTGGPVIGNHSFVFDGERFDPKRATVERFGFDNLGIYIFGAQAVEVEIDETSGKVSVLRAWSAHDVGRAINPLSVEGQIQGGFVQGLGYALSEEMVWDDDGRLANPSLAEYAMPGPLDAPAEINPIILEDPEPTGPFGAKGIGEPALVGVAPAVANAIANASGIRVRTLPMTPERMFTLLNSK